VMFHNLKGHNVKKIRRLDSSGDTVLEFNETDATATAEAKALFERLMGEGRVPFAVNRGEGKTDQKLTSFDQVESDTVFIPRIQGG
jgi:hypothetical protein